MAEWNAKQRCSICLIVEIGMRGICFTAPLPAASHKRGRQYLAKVATGDEVTKILDLWRNPHRSEEHTSELQSLMRISYAVFCLKKKNKKIHSLTHQIRHRACHTCKYATTCRPLSTHERRH